MQNKVFENKEKGFISLFRSIKNWEWYDDVKVKVLFIDLLLTCNWKQKNWKGKVVNRGETITSINNLALSSGLTVKEVRTALKKLEITNEITTERANGFTKITINNFNTYQNTEEDKGQTKGTKKASDRQKRGIEKASKGQQLNKGNKENKENKEIKKEKINKKEIFENFRSKYPGTKKGLETEYANFLKKHDDANEVIEKLLPALEYQIEQREIRKENKQFVPEWKHLQTWLNQRCWEEVIESELEGEEQEEYYVWLPTRHMSETEWNKLKADKSETAFLNIQKNLFMYAYEHFRGEKREVKDEWETFVGVATDDYTINKFYFSVQHFMDVRKIKDMGKLEDFITSKKWEELTEEFNDEMQLLKQYETTAEELG